MRSGVLGGITAALLAGLVAACNPADVSIAPREAVDVYHDRYNAGEFETIWRESHFRFKNTIARETLLARLAHQRQIFGMLQGTEGIGIQYMRNLSGGSDQWQLVMESRFEFGSARETFLVSAGEAESRIIGYNLQSARLNPGRFEEMQWNGQLPPPPPAGEIIVEADR